MQIPCDLIREGARLPEYGTELAADADLFAAEPGTVPARGQLLVRTGLRMWIPDGYRLKLESKSGLAVKFGIEVGAGVIDEDYFQEVGVLLRNHSDMPWKFEAGTKIAQASLEKTYRGEFKEGFVPMQEEAAGFKVSKRTGGYGSTGV